MSKLRNLETNKQVKFQTSRLGAGSHFATEFHKLLASLEKLEYFYTSSYYNSVDILSGLLEIYKGR